MIKPQVNGEKVKSGLKRAMWLFMALLFVVTGLGVGVYAFWQATHQNNNQSTTSNTSQTQGPACTSDPNLQITGSAASSGKLAGTKLPNFTPTPHITSLSCIDAKAGTGTSTVQSSSTITANYTGAVAATGIIFQSSLDNDGQPFSTALSGVIPGWQEGLLGMRAGGERRLLIPAVLAYGAAGSCQTPDPKDNTKCDKYSIPPNTDLVFDVTILAIQ